MPSVTDETASDVFAKQLLAAWERIPAALSHMCTMSFIRHIRSTEESDFADFLHRQLLMACLEPFGNWHIGQWNMISCTNWSCQMRKDSPTALLCQEGFPLAERDLNILTIILKTWNGLFPFPRKLLLCKSIIWITHHGF